MSRFHYVTSHVHGVKHEQQDARETASAAFTPHSGGTEELLSTALRALCLTRDYVEPNVSLPAKEGWEWFDAGVKLSAAIPADKWAKEFDQRRAAFTPVQEEVFEAADAPCDNCATPLCSKERARAASQTGVCGARVPL